MDILQRVRKDGQVGDADSIVYVSTSLDLTSDQYKAISTPNLTTLLQSAVQYNKTLESEVTSVFLPPLDGQTVCRFVYSPVGSLKRDHDDVRRFRDAVISGVKKALSAGARKIFVSLPLQTLALQTADFSEYPLVSLLAAYEALYVPLEIREAFEDRRYKFDSVGFSVTDPEVYKLAEAIELGRIAARDIGGSDPERMSAPKVADYVVELLKGTGIEVQVLDDRKQIEKEFPCLGAVNRGSTDAHSARVILMKYDPSVPVQQVKRSLFLVGKGVTYDTGGHDLKAGGIMAGMHRDKCGAAAVAGFFRTVAALAPKDVKVEGALAMVRNSIGPLAYVSDELITSRSGVRLRVGNTDAEGRMAMVDLLSYFREKVSANPSAYPNPHLFTIATLTGHACIAAGYYSLTMDNGPARLNNVSNTIYFAGEKVGDSFELSSIRREDFVINVGPSEYEDILQCNNLASSKTPRGHQMPAAFLVTVSGLDKNGIYSQLPIAYTHIDIAASSGPFPGIPSGAPIPALTIGFIRK